MLHVVSWLVGLQSTETGEEPKLQERREMERNKEIKKKKEKKESTCSLQNKVSFAVFLSHVFSCLASFYIGTTTLHNLLLFANKGLCWELNIRLYLIIRWFGQHLFNLQSKNKRRKCKS